VAQFAGLSQLTHLDLGVAAGVAALAPQLPNLQSLAPATPNSLGKCCVLPSSMLPPYKPAAANVQQSTDISLMHVAVLARHRHSGFVIW
jgi:hypothetical protein